jgi:hypothetical protein
MFMLARARSMYRVKIMLHYLMGGVAPVVAVPLPTAAAAVPPSICTAFATTARHQQKAGQKQVLPAAGDWKQQ